MRKLYLFDCFGVVLSEISSMWLDAHCSQEQKQYARRVLFRNVDTRVISQDELYEQLADYCGVSKQSVAEDWVRLAQVNWDTIEVIKRIRQRGDVVALLSNASVELIDDLFERFELFQYFDRMFVSARYGFAKPDREFYQICLDSFTERFDKIFFADDNPINLQNLEELGITPVLFTTAEQFEKEIL